MRVLIAFISEIRIRRLLLPRTRATKSHEVSWEHGCVLSVRIRSRDSESISITSQITRSISPHVPSPQPQTLHAEQASNKHLSLFPLHRDHPGDVITCPDLLEIHSAFQLLVCCRLRLHQVLLVAWLGSVISVVGVACFPGQRPVNVTGTRYSRY